MSGVFGVIWLFIILSAISTQIRKRQGNNWSRTPTSKAEERAQALRDAAGKSSPTITAGNSAFRQPHSSSNSRSRFANDVANYSNSNVSGLDKSLERDRGAKSLRDLADFFGEDRRGDWMARQLREEARVKYMGGILDLGAAHDASCDADNLKKEHRLVHSDAIDTGVFGKSMNKKSHR